MEISPLVFGSLCPSATSLEDVRRFIAIVEEQLKKEPQIEIPLKHYFAHKVYAREMKLKATTLIVGKVHLYPNLNILSEGEASVFSIDGVQRLNAPATFIGSKGSKRLIYAHTDITWTTILGTDLVDPEKIADEFTAYDYTQLDCA
jgi:hypothetical protein